ncbi:hypothetical protein ACFO3O_13905 [Dokdonia ponticola]|uniref:Hsp20/alpha crystallin family protein n=1 Tax=Dokdonia ponticola TaxID=2041041 RepID=A0ABV9I068_9FLAO
MSVNDVSKYPISNSVQQNTFKLEELDMRFEDDTLKIKLKSPLLSANNYTVTLENGILTLRVITEKLYFDKNQVVKNPVFTESFLSIPNLSYNTIIENSFTGDGLCITVKKQYSKKPYAATYGVT